MTVQGRTCPSLSGLASPPTQMIRTEANGKNRGSRQDDGAGERRGVLMCASDLLSWGGKKSPELFWLAGPTAERHRQRSVRGGIRVWPVWPLPSLGPMKWTVSYTERQQRTCPSRAGIFSLISFDLS